MPAILSPPPRLLVRRLQNNPNVHKSNCRRWSASPGSPNLKLGIRKSRQASSPQVLYTKSSIKIETQTRKAPKRKLQRDMKRGSSDLIADPEDCNPKLESRMNSEAHRGPRTPQLSADHPCLQPNLGIETLKSARSPRPEATPRSCNRNVVAATQATLQKQCDSCSKGSTAKAVRQLQPKTALQKHCDDCSQGSTAKAVRQLQPRQHCKSNVIAAARAAFQKHCDSCSPGSTAKAM